MARLAPSPNANLTDMQETFAFEYVANGGNGAAAARVAGFGTPENEASRQLAKPHVSARIRQLIALDITSKLGELLTVAWDIAHDPATPPRDRLAAVFGLMDRGGLAVPRGQAGPSVAVQVNVAAGAAEAQAAIKEIWQSRKAREQALATRGHGSGHGMLEHDDSQVIDMTGDSGSVS